MERCVFLIGALAVGFVLVAVLLVFVLAPPRQPCRARRSTAPKLKTHAAVARSQNERLERELRAELVQARTESTQNAQTARGELGATINQFSQTLQTQLANMAHVQTRAPVDADAEQRAAS